MSRVERLEQLLKTSSVDRGSWAKEIENKLVSAYAPSESSTSTFRKKVKAEIDAMLRASIRTKVSEAKLQVLEDKVKALSVQERIREEEENKKIFQKEQRSRETKCGDIPHDDYEVLMVADAAQFHREREEEKRRERNKQREMKRVLDEQVRELKEREEVERKEAKLYGIELLRVSQEHKTQTLMEKQKLIEKNRREKEMRETQLQQRRNDIARRERQVKLQEKLELERIERELAEERRRERQKVLQQKEFQAQVARENAEQKKRRNEQKRREWDEDHARMQEYAAKLEREEKARADYLEMLKQKSSSNQKMYLEATKVADLNAKEDELKAIRFVEARAREAEEKEKRERERRRKELHEVDIVLRSQIKAKELKEMERKQAFHESAIVSKREALKQKELDMEAAREARKKAADLRGALDRQLAEKKGLVTGPTGTKMSQFEVLINAKRFQQIASSPELAQKVKANLKPRPDEVLRQSKLRQKPTIRSSYY